MTTKYRVKIDDGRSGSDLWAEFDRGWDALQYAKSARRNGLAAEVWYDGKLEIAYYPAS